MTLDPKLQAVLAEIRRTRENSWKGMLGEELRTWLNFGGIQKVGQFELEKLFELFDRGAMDDEYNKARAKEGARANEVWIPKISSVLLAGFQRDYVLRTRSRIRYMAHAATRLKSDGKDNGPFTVNTSTLFARIEAASEEQ